MVKVPEGSTTDNERQKRRSSIIIHYRTKKTRDNFCFPVITPLHFLSKPHRILVTKLSVVETRNNFSIIANDDFLKLCVRNRPLSHTISNCPLQCHLSLGQTCNYVTSSPSLFVTLTTRGKGRERKEVS